MKIGSVVRLKSGGMAMTVTEIEQTSVRCIWMVESGQIMSNVFSQLVLEIVHV
jgi:uncharacterized protein YodC (DUF2158 family)